MDSKKAVEFFDEIRRLAKQVPKTFTFTKINDPLPPKPEGWKNMHFKEKEHYNAWMMGTTQGRNLISTAIDFFLRYAELQGREGEIGQTFREGLFNCEVKKDRKVKKSESLFWV